MTHTIAMHRAWDDLGGHTLTILEVFGCKTEDEARDYLASEGIEERHCQHEYDCCGRYYGTTPELLAETIASDGSRVFVFKYVTIQNV